MRLNARQFEFAFPRPALVMGIVNVTPDSFSDGGRFLDPQAAMKHALGLVQQGAEIIDVGGESTRPGATPVSEVEELSRVLPVIRELAPRVTIPISIDTMKVGVASAALGAGASIVNDVAASRASPEMAQLVGATGAGYICMHMQGTPQTMQANPSYTDVVQEVGDFFERKIAELGRWNVRPEQIILDPGIGFGKKIEHNIKLLSALGSFGRFDRPVLVGVSRKSFLGPMPEGRLPAGLACACLAIAAGAKFIRTHDVAQTLQAVRMAETILAYRSQ